MKIWQREMDVKQLNDRGKQTMSDYLGIEFIEIGENYLKARMPVDHRTKQPMGIMHGGASCVLEETVGSHAANCCVNPEAFYCVGLDINTNHIRTAREGTVTAVAKPFHLGKMTQVWGIEITNEEDKLISVTRLTMAVLKR
jgi:1,4-dihydroxy-2-naphthoyl-CoA hydrolase